MKASTALLCVSLLGNVALGVVFFAKDRSRIAVASGSDNDAPAPHVIGSTDIGGTAGSSNKADAALAAKKNAWDNLRSGGDLPDLISRLRAAGFPPAVIRAIVRAEISEQFSARRKELFSNVKEVPYWEARMHMIDPAVMAAHRALQTEQSDLTRDLLGTDSPEEDEPMKYYRLRQFGDIPPEKSAQLHRIASDYSELRGQVHSNANGSLMPEDREQLSFLEKEMRSDFAKVLTPEELLNYDLRSSSTAGRLRSQLSTFQPTEEEFKSLFAAARAVEEKHGPAEGMLTREQLQARQTAMNEQAKRVLGAERFAAFEQATDPRYMMLNRVVARYGLPTTVVPQIGAVQQDIQTRGAALRNNRDLPADQRSAQLNALAAEAEAKLKPLLGDKGLAAYKTYGGQWIQMLNSPPPSPASATMTVRP